MSAPAQPSIAWSADFAQELPELTIPWQAEEQPDPQLVILNDHLAEQLGFDPEYLRTSSGIGLLLGLQTPADTTPVAQAYSGHQFGFYSPRLGDGRALLIGEITDSSGTLLDVHLKGSGRTPFARGSADGRATVGPMLREYVISEAMHALGIPTTRALAVTATGRPVQRDTVLPGAVLTRVASSHLRVGSFQFARATDTSADLDLVRRLSDYAIDRHYPAVRDEDNPYLGLFNAVLQAQATLVAQWMQVGFIHGVMNSDNMTISGQSIDYGPCAFMDLFDPATVYSSIDENGRYAYRNQPGIAEWNLARFAETLLPLFHSEEEQAIEIAQEALGQFRHYYSAAWLRGMKAKLGLSPSTPDDDAQPLIGELYQVLEHHRVDHTSFFRRLSAAARGDAEPMRSTLTDRAALDEWLPRWLAHSPEADLMDRTNPVYIPRNHLVEEALDAAVSDSDMGPFQQLLDAVTSPYRERPGLERYAEPAPESFGDYRTFCGT